MKWETQFTNKIGEESYPIYLIKRNGKYDLQCKYEIYAPAWYPIYEESIKQYEEEIK